MLQTIIARLFYNVMRQLEYNRRGVVTAKKLDAFVRVCARVAFIKTFHCQSIYVGIVAKYRIMLRRQRGKNTVAIVHVDSIGTIDMAKG